MQENEGENELQVIQNKDSKLFTKKDFIAMTIIILIYTIISFINLGSFTNPRNFLDKWRYKWRSGFKIKRAYSYTNN